MPTTTSLASAAFTGTEPFLVGLAPCYWSHVPLLIGQLLRGLWLHQKHGVHCLWLRPLPDDDASKADTTTTTKLVPITKCRLVGHIVAAERKGGGCVQYVVDDGTGMVDCLYWDDEDEDGGGLPALTLDSNNDILPIGELVRVLGKIQCADVARALAAKDNANYNAKSHTSSSPSSTSVPADAVVREIHASIVQPLRHRARPHSMDPEWQHWLDCLNNNNNNTVKMPRTCYNYWELTSPGKWRTRATFLRPTTMSARGDSLGRSVLVRTATRAVVCGNNVTNCSTVTASRPRSRWTPIGGIGTVCSPSS